MEALLDNFIVAPFDFVKVYLLPFIVVLSILVFVHEWGHYIVARMCGVKATVFSIGFGKEIFGRTDKNGTRWKFSMIPLGGYVQFFGDVDPASAQHDDKKKAKKLTKEEQKVAFYTQSVAKRSAIVFAGPAINFILAIVILTGMYAFHGQSYTPPIAAKLMEDMPAMEAGVQLDDKIIEVNGVPIKRFEDIVKIVSINLNEAIEFKANHYLGDDKWSDEIVIYNIKPKIVELEDRFGFKHSTGRIGIYSPEGDIALDKHSLPSAFNSAVLETWGLVTGTLKAVGQMIVGTRSVDELGGIIRIGAYAGEFAQAGIISLITFTALLSVNLGLINLFPIPLLDGGHLVFYFAEALKGKPVSEKGQEYAFRVGLVFLLGIMLFATWNDLVQLSVIDYVVNLIS